MVYRLIVYHGGMRRFLRGYGWLVCRVAEQVVGQWRFITVAAGAEAGITSCWPLELGDGLDFALFQARQLFIEVKVVEVQFGRAPFPLADRRGWRICRRRAERRRWLLGFGGLVRSLLLKQLAGSVEHLQTVAAAHHTARHTQLSVADAETGLAMGALGDETVGHAAIRIVQASILGALSDGDH